MTYQVLRLKNLTIQYIVCNSVFYSLYFVGEGEEEAMAEKARRGDQMEETLTAEAEGAYPWQNNPNDK